MKDIITVEIVPATICEKVMKEMQDIQWNELPNPFEVGKAYEDIFGQQMYIAGVVETLGYGKAFIGEMIYNKARVVKDCGKEVTWTDVGNDWLMDTDVKPYCIRAVGMLKENTHNWHEISKDEYIKNLKLEK